MASYTIETRKLKNGELRYKVTVIVKKNSRIIHRESKTLKKKTLAKSFGIKRVVELDSQGVLNPVKPVPLSVLLDIFMNDRDLWDKTGRTKQYVIRMLRDCDIAKIQSNELMTSDLIELCRNRKGAGAGAATLYHDIAYLRSVMKKAKPVFDITANYSIFEEALLVLIDMDLVARQDFRPNGKTRIPSTDILDFSILTCMRIGEVCKLRREDLNEEHKTVLVCNRKEPRRKAGNYMIVLLLDESFDIAMRQPKKNELIFPYYPRSVTAGFQRVRNSLGIEDLRYHELRREGASRLFDKGYSIEEVAQVTGHRNLNILWQVYTQLFPHKLHEKTT